MTHNFPKYIICFEDDVLYNKQKGKRLYSLNKIREIRTQGIRQYNPDFIQYHSDRKGAMA